MRVDNSAVRERQLQKLARLRAERDEAGVRASLEALTRGAQGGGNLLALSVDAARAKATVGEISSALERAFDRHVAKVDGVRGVYAAEAGPSDREMQRAASLVAAFVEADGRRPKILVAKMGQDGHDRGQKVVATAFSDLGFEVAIGPLFQTPEEVARQAVDQKVHVVGASSLAAGHLTLIPELRHALDEVGASDVMVVVGGVIPPDDVPALHKAGAAAVFPPGTVLAQSAIQLLEALNARLGYAQGQAA